jgi:hypothetical protein
MEQSKSFFNIEALVGLTERGSINIPVSVPARARTASTPAAATPRHHVLRIRNQEKHHLQTDW